jgi:hypothetical protein
VGAQIILYGVVVEQCIVDVEQEYGLLARHRTL